MRTFEDYEDMIKNPVKDGYSRQYYCEPLTEEELITNYKFELITAPAPGFTWYKAQDTIPLSGYEEFIQLNPDARLVGDSICCGIH